MDLDEYQLARHDLPIDADLARELFALWEETFDCSYADSHAVLRGDESAHNINIVFTAHDEQRLAGTSQLTIACADSRLGGLGEVAVPQEFRGRGIATMLCHHARDTFLQLGGEALFLGTVNPAAKRIYERLGWRTLAGSTVMVCAKESLSGETFINRWFHRDDSNWSVRQATPDIRIPLIPLAIAEHPWQMLDANAGLFSTRFAVQNSCMGLYPGYAKLIPDAAVFAAWTEDRRLIGLSTARLDADHHARVDGFVHTRFSDCWSAMMNEAIAWSAGQHAKECFAVLPVDDEAKQTAFESIGFVEAGAAAAVVVNKHPIAMKQYRLENRDRPVGACST